VASELRSDLSMSEALLELPQVFRYHAFCCSQNRPPNHPKGSCGASGANPLWERLGSVLSGRGLTHTAMTATGCLGFCNAGPLMVVYPEGIWYQPRTVEDIDEIVQAHFVEGHLVERLIVVLKQ
jgi:(2Fe-2S) ferredoxin